MRCEHPQCKQIATFRVEWNGNVYLYCTTHMLMTKQVVENTKVEAIRK